MVIVKFFDVVDRIFHGLGKVLNLETIITCELSEPLKARVKDGHHDFLVADLGQFVGFGENRALAFVELVDALAAGLSRGRFFDRLSGRFLRLRGGSPPALGLPFQ